MRLALALASAFLLLCGGSEAAGGGVTAIGKYNYTQVLSYSLLFYHAQRTGKLPATNPIPWRGDSCLNDVGSSGEDLTGGWFDAGDFMKYNFPMAASTTVLAWSIVEDWNVYQAAGLLDDMLDCVKWVTDYLVKCHVSSNVFYGQLDTTQSSHNQWMRPESITWTRTPYKIDSTHPGSDMAAEAAAALAATSIAFRGTNASYADILLRHSHELFRFANTSRGKYTDSITDAAQVYPSADYRDELVWASVWLARASNVSGSVSAGFPTPAAYLSFAEWGFATYGLQGTTEFSWDNKGIGAAVLLARITNKNTYHNAVQAFVNSWLPNSGRTYTPKGLAWYSQWGSLRYSALASWIAASYAEIINSTQPVLATKYLNFSVNQGHYILGDSGRSFVVGFGVNPPDRPHHAAASCPNPPATCDWNTYNTNTPNPHILFGAMVGGPDQNDAFNNVRTDYVQNEVACDYNSGMHALMGKLLKLQLQLSPASIPTTGGGGGDNGGSGGGGGGGGGQSSAAVSDLRAGIVSFLISFFVITFSIFVTMHH